MAVQIIPLLGMAVTIASRVFLSRQRTRGKPLNKKRCRLCYKQIGSRRTQCKGTKIQKDPIIEFKGSPSTKLWKNLGEKNKNLNENLSWEKTEDHPWYYDDAKRSPVQPHHLIPSHAFNKKNKNNSLLYRIGNLCGYDINNWKNGVVLPSKKEAACYLQKQLHSGQHDFTDFNYTNSCIKLIHIKIYNYLMRIKKGELKCTKQEKETLYELFNRSSHDIFQKIKSFKWLITKNGNHYNPNRTHYVGCGCGGKQHNLKKGNKPMKNYDLEIGY